MKTKVLIYVEGGVIQFIAASEDVEIAILNKDEQDEGVNPVHVISPDSIKAPGTFKELFAFADNSTREFHDELDRLNF